MYIRNKIASILWKFILVAIATYGLLDGSGLLAGTYHTGFPHMFTNVSNIFAWGYFLVATIRLVSSKDTDTEVFAPQVKYTAMISLLVTALIAHFMLFDAMFKDGELVVHLVAMHYVVPAMAFLDWLLFDKKGKMVAWGPFAWISLALAYLVVVMIGAGPLGLDLGGGTTAGITRYPYTFLDPAISGVGGVAVFIGAMIVAFLALGYLIFAIDKALGRAASKE